MGEDVKITVIATGFREESALRRERMMAGPGLPTVRYESPRIVVRPIEPRPEPVVEQEPVAEEPITRETELFPQDVHEPEHEAVSVSGSSYYERARTQALHVEPVVEHEAEAESHTAEAEIPVIDVRGQESVPVMQEEPRVVRVPEIVLAHNVVTAPQVVVERSMTSSSSDRTLMDRMRRRGHRRRCRRLQGMRETTAERRRRRPMTWMYRRSCGVADNLRAV
jgi:hypothetical protein